MRWTDHVECTEALRKMYKILVGKQEERKPLWKPKDSCRDNIKMGLKEIGYEDVKWIHVAQDMVQWQALVNKLTSC